MNLCVFQGTFNPIHNAHLRVAKFVLENYNFDKIIFIPACNPPHKFCDPDLAKHRYEMVKLAILDKPEFEISDIEYKRSGKSYTFLTINELYKKYNIDKKINFIIGTDAFKNIESWYKSNELKKLVKFIVFIREENFKISDYNVLKQRGYDFEFQNLPFEDISSTELRNIIKNGEEINLYLPNNVKEYIIKNGLYKK